MENDQKDWGEIFRGYQDYFNSELLNLERFGNIFMRGHEVYKGSVFPDIYLIPSEVNYESVIEQSLRLRQLFSNSSDDVAVIREYKTMQKKFEASKFNLYQAVESHDLFKGLNVDLVQDTSISNLLSDPVDKLTYTLIYRDFRLLGVVQKADGGQVDTNSLQEQVDEGLLFYGKALKRSDMQHILIDRLNNLVDSRYLSEKKVV